MSKVAIEKEIKLSWLRHGVQKPNEEVIASYVTAIWESGFHDPALVHAAQMALEKSSPQQYPHSCPRLLDTLRAMAKSWHQPGSMLALPAHEEAPPPRPAGDPFEDVAQFWEQCPPRGKEAGSRALKKLMAMVTADAPGRRAIADSIVAGD